MIIPAVTIQAVYKVGGVGLQVLLTYIPLVLVDLFPYIVPIAFLLGVAATYGRMAADNEWGATASAGIDPVRLLPPCILLAVLLGGITDWMLSSAAPNWKYDQRSFVHSAQENAFRSLGQGRTEIELGDFFMTFDHRDPDADNVLNEVIINIPHGDGGGASVIIADQARITFEEDMLAFDFENAHMLKGNVGFTSESPRLRIPLDQIVPTSEKTRSQPKYFPSSELRARIESGDLDEDDRAAYSYAIHHRHAISAIYLVFLLLGVPTGVFLRSGTQLAAFSCAIGYAFAYYSVQALGLGEALSKNGILDPIAAAWTTNAIFLVVGLFLTWKVMRR